MDRSRYKFSRNEYLVAFVYMTFASGSHTSQQLEKITKFTIACSIHFDCRLKKTRFLGWLLCIE